ncbi:MAG TPA: septum formation initiator family protein [Pyrinomonadaceae bacterium]|nr:septum formation initiator family protein [Pyrinomonadaceae bacterium]
MNKAANSYWVDTRLAAQRPNSRALSLAPASRAGAADNVAVAPFDGVRRRDLAVPSWVVFCMIMLATFALCATVTFRTHAEMRGAEQKFERMSDDVLKLKNTNESLKREVERLRTDPRAIEAAARTRLNMVRANEIVVPVE